MRTKNVFRILLAYLFVGMSFSGFAASADPQNEDETKAVDTREEVTEFIDHHLADSHYFNFFADAEAGVFPGVDDDEGGDEPDGGDESLIDEDFGQDAGEGGSVAEDPGLGAVEQVDLDAAPGPEEDEEGQVSEGGALGEVGDDLLDEGYVEHDGAKVLVNEIASGGPDEEFYDAKVKVLQEQIEHHIAEEEKKSGNMFQQARAADVDLQLLGKKVLDRKKELKQQAEKAGLPEAAPTTL